MNAMKNRKRSGILFCCAVLLGGCAGYDVVRSSGDGSQAALAPHSVKVLLQDRNYTLNMTHAERGHGLAPAPLGAEDKRAMRARAAQLKALLVPGLLKGVSAGLGGYVNNRDPACELSLQINQIALDLDGSADVVLTVT